MKHAKGVLHGEERIRSEFLFLPKCINDECRWLEFAKWKERALKSPLDPRDWVIWHDVTWL